MREKAVVVKTLKRCFILHLKMHFHFVTLRGIIPFAFPKLYNRVSDLSIVQDS